MAFKVKGYWRSSETLFIELRAADGTLLNGLGGDAYTEPDSIAKPHYYEADVSETIAAQTIFPLLFDASDIRRQCSPVKYSGSGDILLDGPDVLNAVAALREHGDADWSAQQSVIVGPISVQGPPDVVRRTIHLRLDDTGTYRVEQVLDADEIPVDLSLFGSVDLILCDAELELLEVISLGDGLSLINDGSGFLFSPSAETVAEITNSPRHHEWSLRDPQSGDHVIAGGILTVTRFATRGG